MPGFGTRLAVLIVALLVAAAIDRWRYGAEARRAREYGFLLVCGLVGALAGGALDQVSVRVSPEYFELGKGLEGGAGLAARASLLGGQAGFVAGLIAGGALLLVNQPRTERPLLSEARVLRLGLPWVLALAVGGEVAAGLILPHLDPLGLKPWLKGLVADERIEAFVTVQSLHVGLYGGALLGLGLACYRVHRARRGVAPPASEDPPAS